MISIGKYRLKALVGYCLILALILFGNISVAKEVAVIKIHYRWATELVPIVKSMLSADGTVTVSKRANSLIIVDSLDAIQRVQDYLAQFDKPVEQVRIHVRFQNFKTGKDSAVSVRGKISNDNLSAATGGKRKDGVDISAEDRARQVKAVSEFFVVAMSGTPAFIQAGKVIPYSYGSEFYNRFAPGGDTLAWHAVKSGFEVTPTIVVDSAHLRIVPRIAYDDRKDAVIRFFGAQTELTTLLGRWVEIGGATGQQNEVIREILSRGRSSEINPSSMFLMIEKLQTEKKGYKTN
jgi:hypothetical protein